MRRPWLARARFLLGGGWSPSTWLGVARWLGSARRPGMRSVARRRKRAGRRPGRTAGRSTSAAGRRERASRPEPPSGADPPARARPRRPPQRPLRPARARRRGGQPSSSRPSWSPPPSAHCRARARRSRAAARLCPPLRSRAIRARASPSWWAGSGLNASLTEQAIAALPPTTGLAFSPYAPAARSLIEQARARGFETWLALPLEPQGFPLNDPGDRALLTGLPPGENLARLDWLLARFPGHVGAVGAARSPARRALRRPRRALRDDAGGARTGAASCSSTPGPGRRAPARARSRHRPRGGRACHPCRDRRPPRRPGARWRASAARRSAT